MNTCVHCGKPAGEWRCRDCGNKPLCLPCAIEGGLLGLEPMMKQRERQAKREQKKAKGKTLSFIMPGTESQAGRR